MALSKNTITKFVKATSDANKNTQKETTMYGTITSYDSVNKICYVKLDGAGDNVQDIPVKRYTAEVNAGERVIVMIKNHTAVITGNLKSPAAGAEYVDVVVNEKMQHLGVVSSEYIASLWADYEF